MKKFLKTLLALSLMGSLKAQIAIVGGFNGTTAVLVSSTGEAIPLTGPALPTPGGDVRGVSINNSGFAIIGGFDDGAAYAALVSPTGVTSALTGDHLPSLTGTIDSVSINNAGFSIIGGTAQHISKPYVALVSPTGVTSALTGDVPSLVGDGAINSVAINQEGAAVIGGFHEDTVGYAALVSSSGVASAISGDTPEGDASIHSVDINHSGAAIIGGRHNSSFSYVALVSSSGAASFLSGDTLSGEGDISSVSINDAGTAIIGGSYDQEDLAYAALVSSEGVATALSGPNFLSGSGSFIRSVAINNSGMAVIGGGAGEDADFAAYAALVSSTGEITLLTGAVPTGQGIIESVAINDAGIAIIGGAADAVYVALVSPTGVATALTGSAAPPGQGGVNSVAITVNSAFLDALNPKSFGPGSSFANGPFLLSSQILSNHCDSHNVWSNNEKQNHEIGLLLADASNRIQHKPVWSNPKNRPSAETTDFQKLTPCKYSVWAAPFGDYAYQKEQSNIPALNNWIGGILAAFDYQGISNVLLGGGVAYAYAYTHLAEHLGCAKSNQEYLTLYTSWARKNFYINLALWGGLYQTKNVRHNILGITSKADVDGWILLPHLALGTPFYGIGDWFLVEPFAMLDWVNNWQDSVREKGASGLNLTLDSQYTSVLRTEVGARFIEILPLAWGDLILLEKGSWVNKTPFHAQAAQTAFVGAISSFAIEVFSNETQNLGVLQFNTRFSPKSAKYPYGAINCQAELGSSFQSYLISFEIGKDF